MRYDVYRYDTGVTIPWERDVLKVAAAVNNPSCLGIVENLDARNGFDAIDKAKVIFAAGRFTRTPAGEARAAALKGGK